MHYVNELEYSLLNNSVKEGDMDIKKLKVGMEEMEKQLI